MLAGERNVLQLSLFVVSLIVEFYRICGSYISGTLCRATFVAVLLFERKLTLALLINNIVMYYHLMSGG